jgi:Zn-dependent protease
MPRGFQIGRLFGTDIFATPGFLGLLALFFWFRREDPALAAIVVIAVAVSILIHEFGHVTAARKLVGGRAVVLLWFMGGLCLHEPTAVPKKQFLISIMGPLFGLVGGAVCLAVLFAVPGLHPLLRAWLGAMWWIGVIWTGLNLLPILPLDGGQALRALLAARRGPERAHYLARRVSVVTAALFIPIGIYFKLLFFPVLAILLMFQNLERRNP